MDTWLRQALKHLLKLMRYPRLLLMSQQALLSLPSKRVFNAVQKKLAIRVGLGLVLILGVLLASPLATKFAGWIHPLSRPAQVGQIVKITGEGSINRDGEFIKLHGEMSSIPLFSRDRIQTKSDAGLVLALNSQDEIEIAPNSEFQIQLWNETEKNSPLLVDWLAGPPIKILRQGVPGQAYLIYSEKLYRLGPISTPKPLALTVLRNMDTDLSLANSNVAEEQTDSESEKSSDEESAPTTAALFTLSNEYIDEVIAAKQALFQRCWIPRLRENPKLKGSMVLQIEISKRGEVKQVQTIDSSLNDPELERCVSSVIERIRFRPFSGPEISVSYPIYFE